MYMYFGIFLDVQGQLTPQSFVGSGPNIIQDIMVVLVICKNEEDPIKNEDARAGTRYFLYNHMEPICCHGNKSSGPIWPKP